jgi:hypothetical protein
VIPPRRRAAQEWAVQPAPATAERPPDALAVPAIVDTLNGDPKGLKRADLGDAMQRAMPSLAPCLGAAGGNVGLSFDADPDGRARNIKVNGASPSVERCVSDTLVRLKLPTFEGKAVPVQFPLDVYRPAAPPAPPAAAAPAAPPATATSTGGYAPPSLPTTAAAPAAARTGGNPVFIQP